MNLLRKLLRSDAGAMELTFAQLYLFALSLGMGLGRGVEADLQFHTEELMSEANFAASRVAAGHAHSANAIADNNVLSVAAMAPRLAIEADNITMDMNAAIACGNSATPGVAPVMAEICAQYAAGKPRALAKLAWIRQQQTSLWSSLEHLSGSMDKVAGAHAQEDVLSKMAALDSTARVSFDDPTMSRETWSGRSAFTGCSLASKDALSSPMAGHAFPLLMPNMLLGLPQALISGLPALCPSVGDPSSSASAASKGMKLPEIPQVSDNANKRCGESQTHMRDQVSHAASQKGSTNSDVTVTDERPTFSSDVDPFVKCVVHEPGSSSSPKRTSGDQSSFVVRRGNKLYTCTFDRDECKDKALVEETAAFLKSLGLPSAPSFGMLGGSTRAPGAVNPNESDDFRACASVKRPVDERTAQLAENVRYVMSFGAVQTPTELRQNVNRTSSGHWYFPSGAGPFSAVPADQRGFVRAWKHASTAGTCE